MKYWYLKYSIYIQHACRPLAGPGLCSTNFCWLHSVHNSTRNPDRSSAYCGLGSTYWRPGTALLCPWQIGSSLHSKHAGTAHVMCWEEICPLKLPLFLSEQGSRSLAWVSCSRHSAHDCTSCGRAALAGKGRASSSCTKQGWAMGSSLAHLRSYQCATQLHSANTQQTT